MIYLGFLNYLGGFDYVLFTGKKDHNLDVIESAETTTNVFNNWPKSYGAFASTVRKNTFRKTRRTQVIRSGPLYFDQAKELGEQIKTSIVVEMFEDDTKRNKRRVIVDTDSFTIVRERDKMHSLSFTISYTDDLPNQTA